MTSGQVRSCLRPCRADLRQTALCLGQNEQPQRGGQSDLGRPGVVDPADQACPSLAAPLRERRQVMPECILQLIGQFSRAYKKPVREIEREAVNILSSYGWPGNVRELKHVVENMVVVSGGPVLTVENLPESIHQGQHKLPTEVQSLVGVPLKEVEKILIEQTLEQVGGNRQEAARMLGIGERTMYRKLKEYGLS